MNVGTDVSDEVRQLLNCWALHSAEIEPLSGGEQKLVWRVDTRQRAYTLRVYPSFVPAASVRRECRWLLALGAALPEVPSPVRTADGDVVVDWNGRCAVLAPFVDGSPVDASRSSHRRAMACVLARIHGASRGLDRDGVSVYPSLRSLDWYANHWWNVAEIDHCPYALPLWKKTQPRLEQVGDWLERLHGLPETVIHNDFGVVNVLMHGDEVAGVIDWDWATVDWRLLDVAHATRTVSLRGSRFHVQRAIDFLEDYGRCGESLESSEMAALPCVLRLQITWVALYDLGRACKSQLDDDSALYRVLTIDGVEGFASALEAVL